MALRTPEPTLEDMYEVGGRLASSHHFYHNMSFERRPNGTYLYQLFNNPRPLEQKDLPLWEGLQITADGQLEYDRIVEFFDDIRRPRYSLVRALLLTTATMDFCASVLIEEALVSRYQRLMLTIRPLTPQKEPIIPVGFLLNQTRRSGTLISEGWQIELGTTDGGYLYVEASAADIIRGIKDAGDKSWILDSELGRNALRAVLEDPFSTWKKYKRYDALGPQGRPNNYQLFLP